MQGLFSNVLNPKVALFFMAFLPQFVNAKGQESIAIQFIVLGLIFAFFTVVFLTTLGYFAGVIGQYLMKNSNITTRLQRVSGFILILLGIRIAFMKQK
jgi:threonine/homoserine/homoserine lactone efflux protein